MGPESCSTVTRGPRLLQLVARALVSSAIILWKEKERESGGWLGRNLWTRLGRGGHITAAHIPLARAQSCGHASLQGRLGNVVQLYTQGGNNEPGFGENIAISTTNVVLFEWMS